MKPLIQLSQFKRPERVRAKSVNYLQGFWWELLKDWYNKIKKGRPLARRSFNYKLRWEHIVISFLLGALLLGHGAGRIVHSAVELPAAPPPLKTMPVSHFQPLRGLEPVWVNKLRPYGTYANDYAPGNCTWYVASRLPLPGSMGNANNWAYAASLAGLTVSSVPKPGSVAQTAGDSWLGHVAVVESVNPDGSFVISEMNYLGLGLVDSRAATTAEFPNFIYP